MTTRTAALVALSTLIGAATVWLTDLTLFSAQRSLAVHWQIVECYRAFILDPSNYKPDPGNPGLSSASLPADPLPSLAALEAAHQLVHLDLVFPNVPHSREANRLWMTATAADADILYATGNPIYTDYPVSGEPPLHLQLWFRPAAKTRVQELIQRFEALGARDRGGSNSAQEDEIATLIERLAIPLGPLDDEHVPNTMSESDPSELAYDAANKLTKLGKRAFGQLVQNLGDKRPSIAFRRVDQPDVGLACFCIIEDQIYALPDDYQGSFYRKGANGHDHERPLFLAPGIFSRENVADWLEQRADETLPELQLEALDWLIAAEEKIGFSTETDRENTLTPLQRQRAKIAAAMVPPP